MNILAASENPLIPPWGEIIIGLIAFGLVVFVMIKFVGPRFEQVFRARREAIEGGIERAEAMQAEARAALDQYRAQLAEARTEAAQIRDAARAEGQQILEELRIQAQEESARIVARGEEQLAASLPNDIRPAFVIEMQYFQMLKDSDFSGTVPPPAGFDAANKAVNDFGVAHCGFVFDQ